MAAVPENQTRYWRNRSPFPTPSRTAASNPSVSNGNDDSVGNDIDESDCPSGDEFRKTFRSTAKAAFKRKAASNANIAFPFSGISRRRTNISSTVEPGRQHIADKELPYTQEQNPTPPLKRFITWDPDLAPWKPDRPRSTRCSTQPRNPLTTSATVPPDDFNKPCVSRESHSDEAFGPRVPRYRPIRTKFTAVDHSLSTLHNSDNDSIRKCSSLPNGLEGNRPAASYPDPQPPLKLDRARVSPAPRSSRRHESSLVQWPLDVSAAAASSAASDSDSGSDGKDDEHCVKLCHSFATAIPVFELPGIGDPASYPGRPLGEEMAIFREITRCHGVDCDPWKHAGMGTLRGFSLDTTLVPKRETMKRRIERMDCLAAWLVVGLVAVWALLMAANFELAGYEAELEKMR